LTSVLLRPINTVAVVSSTVIVRVASVAGVPAAFDTPAFTVWLPLASACASTDVMFTDQAPLAAVVVSVSMTWLELLTT
jgi:hypothetical protein